MPPPCPSQFSTVGLPRSSGGLRLRPRTPAGRCVLPHHRHDVPAVLLHRRRGTCWIRASTARVVGSHGAIRSKSEFVNSTNAGRSSSCAVAARQRGAARATKAHRHPSVVTRLHVPKKWNKPGPSGLSCTPNLPPPCAPYRGVPVLHLLSRSTAGQPRLFAGQREARWQSRSAKRRHQGLRHNRVQ